MFFVFRKISNIDWLLFFSIIPLLGAGLFTMAGFSQPASFNDEIISVGENLQDGNYFFKRQIVWIFLALLVFFIAGAMDWRFLKNGVLLMIFFAAGIILLSFLLFVGAKTRGAASWFHIASLSINPADVMKLLLILILAKYFSRRHVEIANIKHILVSAFYVAVPGTLIFLQPDFGSAMIIFAIWLGMVMVSGISKRHLALVFLTVILIFSIGWLFALKPYQKERILTFLHPLKDPQGAGYNALQSVIAVGSGQIFGKGIGYGTQSRLDFLPEHQTDFIFAAFAEEWGLFGIFIILTFFGLIIWRILANALNGPGNFERLFGIGLSVFLVSHAVIHIGMNVGLFPITGIPMPFMSYGGSNLITIFAGLGILMSMRRSGLNLPYDPEAFLETKHQ